MPKPQEGSYTCYLFEKGIDKILKKVGEECAETIIAAKNGDKAELVGEINDVFYHMMVMMNECGVTMEDVCKGNGHPRPENRQPEEIPRFRPQYLIFIPQIYTGAILCLSRVSAHEIAFACKCQKSGSMYHGFLTSGGESFDHREELSYDFGTAHGPFLLSAKL